MPSKTSNQDTLLFSLTNKTIYIVGPQKLQNELISRNLGQNTNANCECLDDISYVPSSGDREINKNALALIDCQGNEINGYLGFLPSTLIALFNVVQGQASEEDIAGSKVMGIFYQSDPFDQLLKGIKAIFNGELWFSREVMTRVVLKNRDIFSNKVRDLLTHRELEILSLIAVGAKNEDIAEKLFISNNTVKTHIYNIFKKINVNNRLQAALWAAKNL